MKTMLDQSWFDEVDSGIRDPLVASSVLELGRYVNNVVSAANARDFGPHLIATLHVCRTSQHIRLRVGNLFHMEVAARDKVREALQLAELSFLPLEKYDGQDRLNFEEARKNISFRLDLTTHEDPVACTPTGDRES